MSKVYRMAAGTAMAVSAMTLLMIAEPHRPLRIVPLSTIACLAKRAPTAALPARRSARRRLPELEPSAIAMTLARKAKLFTGSHQTGAVLAAPVYSA